MDVDPSFFNLIFTQSHSTNLANDFLTDPVIGPRWKAFNHDSSLFSHDWFQYWIDQAHNTNKMIYFFRFEDILANP